MRDREPFLRMNVVVSAKLGLGGPPWLSECRSVSIPQILRTLSLIVCAFLLMLKSLFKTKRLTFYSTSKGILVF